MGEGVLVIMLDSTIASLGGSSRHLLTVVVWWVEARMRSVQGRGLPGSSSHRKGTEAEVWSGGVNIPDGSGRRGTAMEKS